MQKIIRKRLKELKKIREEWKKEGIDTEILDYSILEFETILREKHGERN